MSLTTAPAIDVSVVSEQKASELCERIGCNFTKNENENNNGGTHCCIMCKNVDMHGPLCSSKKKIDSFLAPVPEHLNTFLAPVIEPINYNVSSACT